MIYTADHMLCARTFMPTLSKYSWNLDSTSLDRLVQLFLIFSMCVLSLSQVRRKVISFWNSLLMRSRKSVVTVLMPPKDSTKSSLHFLVKNKQINAYLQCWIVIFSAALTAESLTVPGVAGELLLHHGVLPAQDDGILVVRVSVFKGILSLLAQILNCPGEVCFNEIYLCSLLSNEALTSLQFICGVRKKTQDDIKYLVITTLQRFMCW